MQGPTLGPRAPSHEEQALGLDPALPTRASALVPVQGNLRDWS